MRGIVVAADEAHKAALLQASEEAEAEKRRMEEERAAAENEHVAAALRGERELSTARGEVSKLGGELVMATEDKEELVLQLQAWKVRKATQPVLKFYSKTSKIFGRPRLPQSPSLPPLNSP